MVRMRRFLKITCDEVSPFAKLVKEGCHVAVGTCFHKRGGRGKDAASARIIFFFFAAIAHFSSCAHEYFIGGARATAKISYTRKAQWAVRTATKRLKARVRASGKCSLRGYSRDVARGSFLRLVCLRRLSVLLYTPVSCIVAFLQLLSLDTALSIMKMIRVDISRNISILQQSFTIH